MAPENAPKDAANIVPRDPESFARLYLQHSARIFRHVYYLVGNKTEADDLTSETFLRAWQAVGRYEDRGLPIENWLLKIGHNVAAKHLRRKRPTSLPFDALVQQTDRRPSPEESVESASEADAVRWAILQLPHLQRQIIIWRFLESMGYGEVSALLGKTEGAIRVLQHRALKRLRLLMEARPHTGTHAESGAGSKAAPKQRREELALGNVR